MSLYKHSNFYYHFRKRLKINWKFPHSLLNCILHTCVCVWKFSLSLIWEIALNNNSLQNCCSLLLSLSASHRSFLLLWYLKRFQCSHLKLELFLWRYKYMCVSCISFNSLFSSQQLSSSTKCAIFMKIYMQFS